MGKKPGESSEEFRKRMLDPVSPTFCAAKWLNATIWMGSGQTTSCHHPPAHKIDPRELIDDPTAIHNTLHKKLMRAQMLKGERPRECEYCWKIEDIGPSSISDRVYKSDFYDDEDLRRIAKMDWREKVDLKTLEIAFDRACNFACSYCNAGFSTRWAQDIRRFGPYQNLQSDGAGAFQHDGSWADKFGIGEVNPYIQAFWRWWPRLRETLIELRVTGGEPLASPDFWRLLDDLETHGCREEMMISVNSNLGLSSEIIDKMLLKVRGIKNFGLYTSCEAVGVQAEYIRDGMNFDLYMRNLRAVLASGVASRVVIMCTINSLSLFSLTEFLDEMLNLKSEFGALAPGLSLTLLRFPSFMSPSTLPREIKAERAEHLSQWLEKRRGVTLLRDFEIENIERLISYLGEIESPHHRSSDFDQRARDFKAFYTQYDQRRGKNFASTFPAAVVDWYRSIPEARLPKQNLVSGDASEGYHSSEEIEKLAKRFSQESSF